MDKQKTTLGLTVGRFIRVLINSTALLVSWYFNKSILWAIAHYFVGFYYLLYKVLDGAFRGGVLLEIYNYYF